VSHASESQAMHSNESVKFAMCRSRYSGSVHKECDGGPDVTVFVTGHPYTSS
jgi:hypothetical protein